MRTMASLMGGAEDAFAMEESMVIPGDLFKGLGWQPVIGSRRRWPGIRQARVPNYPRAHLSG